VQHTRIAGVELQNRDLALLRGLIDSRFYTITHAADIHFDGKRETAKKRIQKLAAAGLVLMRPGKVGRAAAVTASQRAARLLQSRGGLTGRPVPRAAVSDALLAHDCAVIDAKAAFIRAARRDTTIFVSAFDISPRPTIASPSRFGANRSRLRPDAFVELSTIDGAQLHFFVEVDRSTEPTNVVSAKVAAYRAFFRNGGFARLRGASAHHCRDYPFRVLIICKSIERRNLLARALFESAARVRTFVLLTVASDAHTDPFGPVWLAPADASPIPSRLRRLVEVDNVARHSAHEKATPVGVA
jgi:hypothetical protein